MRKTLIILIATAALLAYGGTPAIGCSFTFVTPPVSFSPEITDIHNTTPIAGTSSFNVYAKIKGDLQQKVCCGAACDRTDCDMADWYLLGNTTISPNPACIPNENGETNMPDSSCKKTGAQNPLVFYYRESDGPDSAQSVPMKYDAVTEKFIADIPIEADWSTGDIIKYYISAADSVGNVTAMLPDKDTAPCSDITTWDSTYATPAIDNCSSANSYTRCMKQYSGTPACAGTVNSTINDDEADACGEPDACGSQIVSITEGTDSPAENVDILGFSVGAGKGYEALPDDDVICAKMTLKGTTPTTTGGPIEGYAFAFLNQDITDPNPADIYFPGLFLITYMPEAASVDKNLVAVLWDGECMTNPNTADIMTCKAVIGSATENKLKIGYSGHELTFITKNEVSTSTGTRNIIGNTTGAVKIYALTFEVDPSNLKYFWQVDWVQPLMLLKATKETTVVAEVTDPAPPLFKKTVCQADGSGDYNECPKSTTKPASNQCLITITPSPDSGLVAKYKVYHNTTNDAAGAEYLPDLDITTDLGSNHTVTYTVPQASLDGSKHYFFFSSANPSGTETPQADWSATPYPCRVEDWTAPAAPADLSCATPDGFEKRCLCSWTPVSGDSTIYGYNIKRGTSQLNGSTILGEYYTDEYNLINGLPYDYSVQAIDIGNNESAWVSASCMPQDLKPPAKIDTLGIVLKSGTLDIDAAWQPVTDSDVATYNLYGCYQDPMKPGSCDIKTGTSSVNGYSVLCTKTPVDHPLACSIDTGFTEGDTWCFYADACDNCKTAGTCPDKTGTDSNCSNFDTISTYMKCLTITSTPSSVAPRWPENQSDGKEIKTTVLSEGNSCKLEWNKICEDTDGSFSDCNYPPLSELAGYYLMRTVATANDCSTTTVPSPKEAAPAATLGTSTAPSYTDTVLTNGTKYCYRVYGYNAAGNISGDPDTPTPVECTPADTQPPDKPVIDDENSYYDTEDGACLVKWAAVEDKDAVSYSVYRCTGDLTTCNSASMFTAMEDGIDLTDTEYSDPSVSTSVAEYSYCVIAKDPSGNTSTKYESTDTKNCVRCGDAPLWCKKPGAVYAYEGNIQYGLKANWQASSSDDSMYDSGEGYNVYLCTSSSPSSCIVKLNGASPVQFFGSDYIKTGSELSNLINSSDDYYIGVSYIHMPSCTESNKTISTLPSSTGGKVHIEVGDSYNTCNTSPDVCPSTLKITGGGANGEIRIAAYADPQCADPSDCMKSPIVPTYTNLTGAVVELVDDAAPTTIIGLSSVGDDGLIPDMAAPLGNSGHTYTVRLKLPADTYSVGCSSKTFGYCYITLKSGLALPSAYSTISVTGKDIADQSTGNGGDIGNPNCDTAVNLTDILLIKNAYGTSYGDTCYRAWADFNSDGVVNLTDILSMTKYYGKTISSTAPTGAVLCASKAPLPACCSTKTCP